MKKRLIVNADDFGQSKGINNGIIQCFEKGILTSASLMVRYNFAEEAAKYSKQNGLDLGIHIDLGEWKLDNNDWVPVYHVTDIENIDLVKIELKKQLEMFLNMTGKNPAHINSHQHVHLRKNILPAFQEIAESLNIPLRSISGNVNYCGDFYGQDENGNSKPQYILVENLKKIIGNLNEGITELACHPATEIDFDTMYAEERMIEVSTLCDFEVKEKIRDENIELCSFSGILN